MLTTMAKLAMLYLQTPRTSPLRGVIRAGLRAAWNLDFRTLNRIVENQEWNYRTLADMKAE